MNTAGPYDRDPPWSEGPSPEPERCDACGEERFESDATTCGGCGFTWVEIDKAVRIVHAIRRELDVITITEEKRRKLIDVVLGEMVEP